MTRIGLYWATIRHLRTRQIAWRLRHRVGDALGLRPRVRPPAQTPDWDAAALDRIAAWVQRRARHLPPAEAELDALRAGRFTFQRHTVETDGQPPWTRADVPRLWRYHLHYFECAQVFASAGSAEDGARLLDWMRGWVAGNPPGTDVAWDAFPTSVRLMQWAIAQAAFRFDAPDIARSHAHQAAWLLRRIEYDVDGNHLLKNAAALTVAGTVSPNADTAARGLALLEACCAEQILPDGGHYERSPMYHLHVLEDLLLARAALADPPRWLDDSIRRMLRCLHALLHPDGDIPLFNDAARDPARPGAALLAAARSLPAFEDPSPPPDALPESGFYRLGARDGPGSLIAHAGPVGPDHQPGHAHGGLLGYELAAGETRLLVDRGVHGYAGSRWRAYCRSTRAHNTVSVNGRDAIDAWGVFRVGRRADGVVQRRGEGYLCAWHDGFAPWRHFRSFQLRAPGVWEIWDEVVGPGRVDVESFLHAPPEGRFSIDDAGGWLLEVAGARLRIQPMGCDGAVVIAGAEDPIQGWDCPEFGLALPAPTLVLRASGPTPLRLGYRLRIQ